MVEGRKHIFMFDGWSRTWTRSRSDQDQIWTRSEPGIVEGGDGGTLWQLQCSERFYSGRVQIRFSDQIFFDRVHQNCWMKIKF